MCCCNSLDLAICIPLFLPTDLTVDNVLRGLKDVLWETLAKGKTMSSGVYKLYGILWFPDSQRRKIEAEYSTEDQWKTAAVLYWLVSDLYASWRSRSLLVTVDSKYVATTAVNPPTYVNAQIYLHTVYHMTAVAAEWRE